MLQSCSNFFRFPGCSLLRVKERIYPPFSFALQQYHIRDGFVKDYFNHGILDDFSNAVEICNAFCMPFHAMVRSDRALAIALKWR